MCDGLVFFGAADPWTHFYRRGAFLDTWHRDGRFFQEKGNATELVAAEAVSRIRGGRMNPEGRRVVPWFVYVPFHAVHTPVDAPANYVGDIPADLVGVAEHSPE
jgi:hypothetical protein